MKKLSGSAGITYRFRVKSCQGLVDNVILRDNLFRYIIREVCRKEEREKNERTETKDKEKKRMGPDEVVGNFFGKAVQFY